MSAARFVVLGLGHVRADWFPEVARWATTGHLPLEFVKCVSAEDLRARAASGRRFSAALVDARLPAVDRDLIGGLLDVGVPTLVVGTTPDRTDWSAIGAATCLPAPLARESLLLALEHHAAPVAELEVDLASPTEPIRRELSLGRLVAVTGSAGSGRSTVAAAVAQHLAERGERGEVVLVDLARRAHQALLHDVGDLVPGIQELVEACRNATLTGRDLRPFAFHIDHRGYDLVVGLRRSRDWVTIRSRAFSAAIESLRSGYGVVVADVDDDVEGEAETGSFDIEDRNLMARATLARADVVLLVAQPTVSGLHSLIDSLHALREFGIEHERIVVVVNRGPRPARARADLTRTIATLVAAGGHERSHAGIVFVPDRRHLDLVHRDRARLPGAVTDPPGQATTVLLGRLDPRPSTLAHEVDQPSYEPDLGMQPERIIPGSLGTWIDDPEHR